ncbi:hypothetical protein LXL04_007904 [Taraxacum kok-saghyz]
MRQELSSDGGERSVESQPLLEGLEDMEEEQDGLACMVEEQQQSHGTNDECLFRPDSDVNATNETVMQIEQRRFHSRVCPDHLLTSRD